MKATTKPEPKKPSPSKHRPHRTEVEAVHEKDGTVVVLCPACDAKIPIKGVVLGKRGVKLSTEATVACRECGVRFAVHDSRPVYL